MQPSWETMNRRETDVPLGFFVFRDCIVCGLCYLSLSDYYSVRCWFCQAGVKPFLFSQELVLRHRSSSISGVDTQCQEKHPEDNIFMSRMRLGHHAGTVVLRICGIHLKHPDEYQTKPEIMFHNFKRILGLLGILHLRPFQLWLRARRYHPRSNPQRQIRVSHCRLCTLSYGKEIYKQIQHFANKIDLLCKGKIGSQTNSICFAKENSTHKQTGAALDGRPAQGLCRGHHHDWHINCLELMAVILPLKYFLQQWSINEWNINKDE